VARAHSVFLIQLCSDYDVEAVFTVKHEAQRYLRLDNNFNLLDMRVHRYRDGDPLGCVETVTALEFLA
jgi:hypothetical protein